MTRCYICRIIWPGHACISVIQYYKVVIISYLHFTSIIQKCMLSILKKLLIVGSSAGTLYMYIKKKRKETKPNKAKRNETERNEIKQNATKPNKTKRNRNQTKINEFIYFSNFFLNLILYILFTYRNMCTNVENIYLNETSKLVSTIYYKSKRNLANGLYDRFG